MKQMNEGIYIFNCIYFCFILLFDAHMTRVLSEQEDKKRSPLRNFIARDKNRQQRIFSQYSPFLKINFL